MTPSVGRTARPPTCSDVNRARREHGAGVRVQRVQIPRYEPDVVEDGTRLVKRLVGPEGECCANDPCVPDESSFTSGGVNGVDGVQACVAMNAASMVVSEFSDPDRRPFNSLLALRQPPSRFSRPPHNLIVQRNSGRCPVRHSR